MARAFLGIGQGSSILALEVQFTAYFHSDPNQTPEQANQGSSGLLESYRQLSLKLNSAGKWISSARVENIWHRQSRCLAGVKKGR